MAQYISIDRKLQALFRQLLTYSDTGIEDDTVIQKLQSSLQKLIIKRNHSLEWCESVEIFGYICMSLHKDYIKHEKNYAAVGFALHTLSVLVAEEKLLFFILSTTEVMKHFKDSLPYIRENMSLTSQALKVVRALINDSSGLAWVDQNGVWENLLISTLTNQSIFVQKECVNVITCFLLNIRNEKHFNSYVRDLELVLYKIRESKHQLKQLEENEEDRDFEVASSIAKLRFNSETVLLVFYNLLFESLGKRSLYTQLKKLLDLTSKILFRFNFEMNSAVVIKLCKMLLLSTLHRFQDQILKLGTAEQFHLDSVTSDILSLTRHMISKGYHKEFLIASFSLHKYWYLMCKNIREKSEAELSKCDSIVFVILKFQVAPIRVVCSSSRDMGTEDERKSFESNYFEWKKNFLTKLAIREEQQLEMIRLVGLIKAKLMEDLKAANEQCIAHLNNFISVIDYLHPTCASTLFQVLVFALKFKAEVTSSLERNSRFYLSALECLKKLIERFDIDWRVCFEFTSLLPVLCSHVWVPGITTRVKVVTLQTMTTCIARFIRIEDQDDNSSTITKVEKLGDADLQKLGETISIFLSDTEWEVRDSALEVILTCLKVQKENGIDFHNWFIKFRFVDYVLQALGDMEPYVQASALGILASLVTVNEIWPHLENAGVKHKALRAVVRSGESCVRKAGFYLLQKLLTNSKFLTDEVEKYVLPVVQNGTLDPDDEVRIAALKFIRCHLDRELMLMGMMDGEFPKVVFQCGKITNLVESEVEKRVSTVISSFCENGYFKCLMNCANDNARTVAFESIQTLNYFGRLISKYNLTTSLSSALQTSMDTTTKVCNHSVVNSSNNEVAFDSHVSLDENALEEVLNMSDINVISRLKNYELSYSNHWWEGDTSQTLLKEEEIPTRLSSVGSTEFFPTLEKAWLAIRNPLEDDSEREIDHLIEDIFLATGFLNTHEDRDCY